MNRMVRWGSAFCLHHSWGCPSQSSGGNARCLRCCTVATVATLSFGALIAYRPLELVRPFLAVLPDIEPPERRVSFREKAGYTATALFVFLVCSQLPLYGIKTNSGSDPFYWARVIMASNR